MSLGCESSLFWSKEPFFPYIQKLDHSQLFFCFKDFFLRSVSFDIGRGKPLTRSEIQLTMSAAAFFFADNMNHKKCTAFCSINYSFLFWLNSISISTEWNSIPRKMYDSQTNRLFPAQWHQCLTVSLPLISFIRFRNFPIGSTYLTALKTNFPLKLSQ